MTASSPAFTSHNTQPRHAYAFWAQVYGTDVELAEKARMVRELAAWYRTLAARAGNPAIWEARLPTAEDLDADAKRIDPQQADELTQLRSKETFDEPGRE